MASGIRAAPARAGLAANATERAVRGVTHPRKLDGIYRADQRGDSLHSRQPATDVARQLTIDGDITPETGKAQLLETRRQVAGLIRFVSLEARIARKDSGRARITEAAMEIGDVIPFSLDRHLNRE